ncbi:hypothetical protein Pint_27517 [Pistacia integerrima]|uniref:Uncharacterized protein n=1 Tax=Pistacia integerrima TaxID=434235 RepID=A0ACC0YUV6_9ROSI|nr:hypothetical protein Pint_27517 [Pistacia integerrima]
MLFVAFSASPITIVASFVDFTTLFILETDASGVALGVVFSQHGHPIAYYKKVFSPQMRNPSTYAREMTTITVSVAPLFVGL